MTCKRKRTRRTLLLAVKANVVFFSLSPSLSHYCHLCCVFLGFIYIVQLSSPLLSCFPFRCLLSLCLSPTDGPHYRDELKVGLLPASALMRERSKRRAELFSLSQSSSQRLFTVSLLLYCCCSSMWSYSAATVVIMTFHL